MKHQDYIDQMVQETLSHTDPANLLKVYHDELRHCYVFENNSGQKLEAPVNWGPFKNKNLVEYHIDRTSDEFSFLPIISQFYNASFFEVRIMVEEKYNSFKTKHAA